ncbi:MAG: hypothetical protein HYY49_14805 [Ignavibacteriales bacterium]|nr:hypothetical protein [Ignavibacteriales bacterium]
MISKICTLLIATVVIDAYAQQDSSANQMVVVQGVLNVGELFIPAIPAENGLPEYPASISKVYYLQLPTPLATQLKAQQMPPSIIERLPEESGDIIMVDIGWPDNDAPANPFGLNKKVGMKLKVRGVLSFEFRAPQTHLSKAFLKAANVEVLKSFDTNGW